MGSKSRTLDVAGDVCTGGQYDVSGAFGQHRSFRVKAAERAPGAGLLKLPGLRKLQTDAGFRVSLTL